MKYVFLDTNIYLHYIDIDNIKWSDIIEDEDFIIIVPKIVIREIDRHKDQSRGKIQKKAKSISSKFAQILLDGIKSKYIIETCKDPSKECFESGDFNKDINDDWFILSALKSGYDIQNIVVISSDNNLLLKAKENGLKYKKMPEKYLVKEELSEEEKEIKALKQELEQYKNRQPKPSIRFSNDETKIVFKKPLERDLEKELCAFMDNIKKEYPYLQNGENIDESFNILFINPQEQINKYNNELNDYFKEEEDYNRFLIQKNILDERFKEIKFYLINEGNAQTGDMDIFIEFPNDINLYHKKSQKSIYDIPPIKPQNSIINRNLLCSFEKEKIYNPLLGGSIPQIYSWDINDTIKCNKFKFNESRLNHNIKLFLNRKDSIYIDTGNCHNFKIKWVIVDSKIVPPVEGVLNVIIE